jgi:hypothetical protein
MNLSSADLSTILDRILDTAADNLRVAKILIQLGLDPNNVTSDALFNRLLEIVLANITLANLFALVGSIFFVATLLMQTMVPLRVATMIGCAFFAGFGALAGSVTTFLHLLPRSMPIVFVRCPTWSGKRAARRRATVRGNGSPPDRANIKRRTKKRWIMQTRNVPDRPEISESLNPLGFRRDALRNWLPVAQQPADGDGRMHRGTGTSRP